MMKQSASIESFAAKDFASLLVMVCLAFSVASDAQTVITRSLFNGANGRGPGPLTQGVNGKFYGTAYSGGTGLGGGTFFEITPEGKMTLLYNFCSEQNCDDGAGPRGTLALGSDGYFYGNTYEAGANIVGGTVFKVSPMGTLTTLYSFCSKGINCSDGANPDGGLVLGPDGSFYGATAVGGSGFVGNCIGGGNENGCGTLFKISPEGTFATLYNFCSVFNDGCVDGWLPIAPLTLGQNGNLYGATSEGGIYNGQCFEGCGTIFEITPAGKLTTIYDFCSLAGCADGARPAGLMLATDGNFYGTTGFGPNTPYCPDSPYGCGTAFKITPQGRLTTLYNFCSLPNCADGQFPNGVLVQAGDGNFYGTTADGGLYNNDLKCNNEDCGTIFQMTPRGELTTLYNFCSLLECADGADPGTLMQATNGLFYGPAFAGGDPNCKYIGCGSVYELSMSLGPFVEANPDFGRTGRATRILGNNLTGTTSVTFNNQSANFTVISDTYIRAIVPPGATTGYVTVMTPTGVLTSNVPFRVIN